MYKLLTLIGAFFLALGGFAQVEVVTNTNNTGAGSLRQAIINANANASIDLIKFEIPTSDPNYNAGTGVYTITVTGDSLPKINNDLLVIDGNSQKAFTSNSNTTLFGTGGTVGIDGLTLDQVDGPEIELVDGGNFIYGLFVESDDVTIQGLVIYGFGNAWNNNNANIAFHFCDNGRIESCVLGTKASAMQKPTANPNGGNNFIYFGSDNAVITNNFVAYSDAMGGYFTFDCNGAEVYNNEFAHNSQVYYYTDGLDIAFNTSTANVYGNYFHNNLGNGFDTYTATGGHSFENNTVTQNGRGNQESAGVRVYGSGNTYRKNIIHTNYGAGVMVTSAATNMTISENSIYDNGSIASFPVQPWPTQTYQVGIDLLKSGDDHGRGTGPFYTVNDDGDVDAGGNTLLNFPVIESATQVGGNLVVKGFAPAGAKIEFFIADYYTNATYPQGKTFLFSRTEGSVDDADGTTGAYGPADINGYPQGSESNANRFSFTLPMPAGLSLGDDLTATATVTGTGTSEFGGAVTVSQPALQPVVNCVYVKGNGDYVAKFGYVNSTSAAINEPIGSGNQFTPAPQDRGQGTNFAVGTYSDVVSVTFSAGSISWTLDGTTVTADAASARCDADLEITQSVSNNAPTAGDNVTFTLTLTNHSTDIPQSGIEINYVLDADFVYVSNTPASGSYTHAGAGNSGTWSVPELLPGQSTTLEVVVTINGDGAAVATIDVSNQVDNNNTNNSATENLTTSGSSGGHGGGIESNGSLAEKIAHRNFTRQKEGNTDKAFYANLDNLTTLAQHKRSAAGKTSALSNYIPNGISQSTRSVVSSPTDLIGITNATNIFAADYFNAEDTRLGVVLAMETRNSVYEHTKIVCDRLRGGQLEEISTVMIDNKPFRMVKLLQEDGAVDYAVSFVVYQDASGNFSVDQKWNLSEYSTPATSKIFNFQVWTISPSLTIEASEAIFDLFKLDGNLIHRNNVPATVPSVYVTSGEYRGGKLILHLSNAIGASQINVIANKSNSESSAGRTDVYRTVSLPAHTTNPTVEVNIGYIFDVDFTITNNQGGGTDKLYFADGPWGRDWETAGVQNANYTVSAETDALNDPNVLYMERDVAFNGRVKKYALIYKMMRAGARPLNLTAYNQVKFEAAATGIQTIEVTLVKEGIAIWSQQYRKNIQVDGTLKEYTIDFTDFVSTAGQGLWADDIVTINFAVIGDGSTYKPTTMQIKNVQFNQNGKIGLDENTLNTTTSFDVQPNPFVGSTFFNFELESREAIRVEVYDLGGRLVATQAAETFNAGQNTIPFTANSRMEAGVYIVKLISDQHTRTERMIMAR